MNFFEIIILLAILGFFIGFISGLVGMGGGILFVPTFWFVFPLLKVKPELVVKSSVATSSACMTITTFTSAYHHLKTGYLNKEILKNLLLGLLPGVILGASLTSLFLPPRFVKIFFALLLIIMAYKMLKGKKIKEKVNEPQECIYISRTKIILIGSLAGILAGMLGIGGGALITPMLHNFCNVPIKEAMATNTGVIFLSSLVSTLSYIFFGIKNTDLPYFLGYIYLPAVVFMIPFLIIGTKLGIKIMYKSHPDKLRKIFAIILILVSINVIYKSILRG